VLVKEVVVPVSVLLSLVVMVAGSIDDMLLVVEKEAYVKLDPVGSASGPVMVVKVRMDLESDAVDWANVVEVATRQRLSQLSRIMQRCRSRRARVCLHVCV